DLDRMRPDDIRMLPQPGPEPAFRGKPADPDPAPHQLAPQSLERDHLPARASQVVIYDIDQAHPAFVDVEDLEPVAQPFSHRNGARHAASPPSCSMCPPLCPMDHDFGSAAATRLLYAASRQSV